MRATEIFYVIEPGDADFGVPALAFVPGAFKEGFRHDGPDCLVEIPAAVGGVTLQEGMQLTGMAHIFVDEACDVRPDLEELRVVGAEPVRERKRWSIWD